MPLEASLTAFLATTFLLTIFWLTFCKQSRDMLTSAPYFYVIGGGIACFPYNIYRYTTQPQATTSLHMRGNGSRLQVHNRKFYANLRLHMH